MKNFTHLSYNEQRKIYSSLFKGKSKKEIAIMLERSTPSIPREVRRNSDAQGYYLYPGETTEFVQKRRHRKKPKIENNKNLRNYIIEELHLRWSPNSIAGQLNQENKKDKACKKFRGVAFHPRLCPEYCRKL